MAQHAMAQPQAYRQALPQQNKGTLVPGQTISVNKYTVQVERYLSQGGFAHVYLVRTATPLYGTTHHVLKRVAVSTEAMLTEVKKEVDIMRILRGHPNIVYLIDAAWHRMGNGTYEVFILMEFCAGGGIIDMMNRRLRERLTEPEILSIFVDVCEGLAAMHALKPPLLHRDLKVENILQSSATSYKLCDFGSATPVQKVPNNIAELRALEADLNKHTTLQYRAPEMVDVFLRRPIDEKSDVWALGVLLYKLCYYTTPFEEHGPLAILNVQYKIPPYPVYSPQMNALIASMLREHGAQRPTVFEILTHVHTLRGTKSRFTYSIPSKHHAQMPLQTLSPNMLSPSAAQGSSLDDLVMFKSRSAQATANVDVPVRNNGMAREPELDAITPMRRGRPTHGTSADAPPSPKKPSQGFALDMKIGFGDEEDRAWKGLGVRGHKSGMASFGSASSMDANVNVADPWTLASKEKETNEKASNGLGGFENDFTASLGAGAGFGDSFQPKSSKSPLMISRPTPSPVPADLSSKSHPQARDRDAFEGLGLPGSAQTPQRTLGEAHRERERSRSGAGFSLSTSAPSTQPSGPYLSTGLGSSTTHYRPPSTHAPAVSPQPQLQPTRQPSRSPAKMSRQETTAEERFPSLEELDKTFQFGSPTNQEKERAPSTTRVMHATTQPARTPLSRHASIARPPSRTATNMTGGPTRTEDLLGLSGVASSGPGSGHLLAAPNRYDGTRSQHVTGIAMRESRLGGSRQSTWETKPSSLQSGDSPIRPHPRRHRSSISIKPSVLRAANNASPLPTSMITTGTGGLEDKRSMPILPPRPSPQPELHDWLTGKSDDEIPSEPEPAEKAILRNSPRKRASYIERSPVQLQKPLEAESVDVDILGLEAADLRRKEAEMAKRKRDEEILRERELARERREQQREREKEREREMQREREREKERQRERVLEREREKERERQAQQEKERVQARSNESSRVEAKRRSSPSKGTRAFITRPTVSGGGLDRLQLPALETTQVPVPISSSPGGLTENWSPVSPSPPTSIKPTHSSSSDEGPEEVDNYVPRRVLKHEERSLDREEVKETGGDEGPRRRQTHSRNRQSSVHDLVDLWGGGSQEKPVLPTKLSDKRRSAIVSPSYMRTQFRPAPPSTSSQAVASSPPIAAAHTSGRPLPRPPSQQHHKESSVITPSPSLVGPSSPRITGPSPALSGRSRPQSMFINPVSRTAPLESTLSHSTNIPEEDVQPTEEKQRRAARRTSISNMVQKYEAINGVVKQGTGAPPVAAKPSALSVKTPPSDTFTLPSPSAAATRFPKLSPTTSPVLTKASLAVADDSGPIKGRFSPAPRAPPASSRPPTANIRPSEHLTGTATGGFPPRKSPLELSRPSEAPSTRVEDNVTLSVERKPTSSPEQLRAPSPERPYQGVSKLIDRWQRVAEDKVGGTARAPTYAVYIPKKAGASNSSSR